MKTAFVILLVLIGMVFAGWITFTHSPGRASVTLETEVMKKDVDKAVEQGKELTDEARRKMHDRRHETAKPAAGAPGSASPQQGQGR